MMRKFLALGLVALSLSACAGTFSGGIGGAVSSVSSQIDQVLPELVMEKAVALHNLSVGLAAINATPGMVTTAPIVGTTTPTVPAVPVPVPAPAPVSPTGPLPTAPTTNG